MSLNRLQSGLVDELQPASVVSKECRASRARRVIVRDIVWFRLFALESCPPRKHLPFARSFVGPFRASAVSLRMGGIMESDKSKTERKNGGVCPARGDKDHSL